MRVVVGCTLLVASLLFASVAAGQPRPPTPTAKAATPPPQDRIVCRKERDTGSLIRGRRVCRTAKQWDEVQQATRDSMLQGQMSGGSSGQ